MIDVPETDRLPRSRKLCPSCEAGPNACRSHHFLTGRWCCEGCEQRRGDHDTTEETR